MRAPRRPLPAHLDLLNLLWKIPLYSLPFAAFFLFLQGASWTLFGGFYIVAMVISAGITISLWVTTHALRPLLERNIAQEGRRTIGIAGLYLFMSLLGAAAGLLAVNATLVPGFLGNAHGVFTALVYTLLFSVLFMALALAINFYQLAMNRGGSEREIQLARRIQRSFLLSEFPNRPRLEIHATNVSSKEVSGDFYDVIAPSGEDILLAIADVSGKGVPAALLSSMLQASVRTQAGTVPSPAAILRTLNTLACQRTNMGQFATFVLAIVHEPTMTLRYANAGHNFPVLLRAGQARTLLDQGGTVLGMIDGLDFAEGTHALREGDRLVFYTDGVTEAARPGGEMYGEERLYALLDSLPVDLPTPMVVERVLGGVREFLGVTEAGDDITVMAVRVRAAGSPA